MGPKLPKFGVPVASNWRIAPLGSSVRAIVCGEVSASVRIERVAEMGVVGEFATTGGAETVMIAIPPAKIVWPAEALVVNPGVPVIEAEITCASTGAMFVSVKV